MTKKQADNSNWSDATESGRMTLDDHPVLPGLWPEYPKVLYRHDRLDRVTVNTPEAEAELGEGWFPTPRP